MDSNNNIVISTRNLSKVYKLYNNPKDRLKETLHPKRKKYHKEFYALRDVNIEIRKGEVIGIIGKNGSGKSTLLKIISNVLTPSRGEFEVKGKVSSLLELGSGFNPELTGIDNIYFYGTILGFPEEKVRSKLQEIIDFADIGDFINQPLKTYSSGMKARLAFAVAINVDPDILILDEILAVGDELFRRKCYARMEKFFKGGKTILYVSHSVPAVNELCTRAYLLNNGEAILEGPAKMVTAYYQKLLYSTNDAHTDVMNEIKELNLDEQKKESYLSSNKTDESLIQVTPQNIIIENGRNNDNYISKVINSLDTEIKPYYVPGFKPQSTITNKIFDIEIKEFKIKTTDGLVVNHLISGESYIYEYSVHFNEDLTDINFGMGIKDEKGYPLSWIIHPIKKMQFIHGPFIKGTNITVSTQFNCLLIGGNYYIDSGIRININGESKIAIKVKDCLVFKVLKSDINIGGKSILIDKIEIKHV